MKIELTFNDPDAIGVAISEAAADRVDELIPNASDRRQSAVARTIVEDIYEQLEPWISGERVTIVFDTDTKTATVATREL